MPQVYNDAGSSTTIENKAINMCEVLKTYTPDEYILYLLELILSYPQHKWISDHQAQATINALDKFKGGNMVSCWDYSENALLANKLNVQSEHFYKVQVTLLIC